MSIPAYRGQMGRIQFTVPDQLINTVDGPKSLTLLFTIMGNVQCLGIQCYVGTVVCPVLV